MLLLTSADLDVLFQNIATNFGLCKVFEAIRNPVLQCFAGDQAPPWLSVENFCNSLEIFFAEDFVKDVNMGVVLGLVKLITPTDLSELANIRQLESYSFVQPLHLLRGAIFLGTIPRDTMEILTVDLFSYAFCNF